MSNLIGRTALTVALASVLTAGAASSSQAASIPVLSAEVIAGPTLTAQVNHRRGARGAAVATGLAFGILGGLAAAAATPYSYGGYGYHAYEPYYYGDIYYNEAHYSYPGYYAPVYSTVHYSPYGYRPYYPRRAYRHYSARQYHYAPRRYYRQRPQYYGYGVPQYVDPHGPNYGQRGIYNPR